MISAEYIAGFFDGEGSVGVYGRNRKDTGTKCGFHLRSQIVQTETLQTKSLFEELIAVFGGNASPQRSSSGRSKRNWQLTGDRAVEFLKLILPHLRLKRDQARLAIAWQQQRPPVIRNSYGQICAMTSETAEFNRKVGRLLKELKTKDIDQVMAQQTDLVEILTELTPLAVVKG